MVRKDQRLILNINQLLSDTEKCLIFQHIQKVLLF